MDQEEWELPNGSGTQVSDINRFMKSFEMTQKMMRKIKDEKGLKNMMNNLNTNNLKNFR